MPAPKKEDYRVTRGKALEAEKKRVAANPNKKVVLPSKENVKKVAGLALAVAGPGKVVKGAQLAAKAVKAGSEGRAVARGLKAAQGPSLAKGAAKTAASSGKYERNIAKITAESNIKKGLSKKEAYAKAAKTMDIGYSKSVEASKKLLARAAAEKKAKIISKNLPK
jgi:hypothetical protein